jgi:hypothetical protein
MAKPYLYATFTWTKRLIIYCLNPETIALYGRDNFAIKGVS